MPETQATHGESLCCSIELREAGGQRRLHGVLIQEGRVASQRKELFAPGACRWLAEGVDILTEHRGQSEARTLPTRQPDGSIVIDAAASPGMISAVESGKRFMSVEFHALAETRNAANVREIQSALIVAGSLTDDPEYQQTSAELRDRGRRRRFWL